MEIIVGKEIGQWIKKRDEKQMASPHISFSHKDAAIDKNINTFEVCEKVRFILI